MTSAAESFNRSPFGVWINSPAGRVSRAAAGTVFLLAGLNFRHSAAGKAALAWGVLPFTAGAFDLCYVSAALGGPLRGGKCREARR